MIYLIVFAAVACVCPTQPNWINAGSAVNTTLTMGEIKTCTSNQPEVVFTMSKTMADRSLEQGARVWKVSFMPLKINQLVRESKTTYSVTEQPMELEKP